MTIKDLCFQAQSSLQSQHGITAKRSHLYEALAALLGYPSHAALSAEALYAESTPGSPRISVDKAGALARVKRFGYTPDRAEAIVSTLSSLARKQRLCIATIDAVLRDLDRNEREDVGFGDWTTTILQASSTRWSLKQPCIRSTTRSKLGRGSTSRGHADAIWSAPRPSTKMARPMMRLQLFLHGLGRKRDSATVRSS